MTTGAAYSRGHSPVNETAKARRLRLLGREAGGCSSACSEMHTFTWPCEQSMMPSRREERVLRAWRWLMTPTISPLFFLVCLIGWSIIAAVTR